MTADKSVIEAVSQSLQRIDIERGTGPIVNPSKHDAEAKRFVAMMEAYEKARRE